MNRPILRLDGLVVLLFVLLVAFTSRWTVFEAASLRENPLNQRSVLESRSASSAGRSSPPTAPCSRAACAPVKGPTNAPTPAGEEFAQAIGYSYPLSLDRTGLERFRNTALTGQTQSNLQSILNQLQGRSDRGDRGGDHARPHRPAGGACGARRPRGRRGGARPVAPGRSR